MRNFTFADEETACTARENATQIQTMNNTMLEVGKLDTQGHWNITDYTNATVLSELNSTVVQVIQTVLLIECMVSISANLMAIIVIASQVAHKKPVHKFLMSISVSDCLVSVALVCMGRGVMICEVASLCYFAGSAVEANLAIIAVDQYAAICHPLRHRKLFSARRSNVVLVILWSFCALYGLSYYMVSVYTRETRDSDLICIGMSRFEKIWLFITGCIFHGIYLPLFCVLYCKMLVKIREVGKVPACASSKTRVNRKGIITTLFIAATYLSMNLPLGIAIGAISIGDPEPALKIKIIFSFFVVMGINSISDPFIYSLRMKDVREGYKRMLCRVCDKTTFANSQDISISR